MELAGLDPDELPAFSEVKGVPPKYWDEVGGLDWLLTFSIHFEALWNQVKDSFVEMAYALQ